MSQRAQKIIGHRMADRWMAEIHYRIGQVDGADAVDLVTVSFEEVEDLDEIIERGPDWNTIDQIVITLNRPTLGTGQ